VHLQCKTTLGYDEKIKVSKELTVQTLRFRDTTIPDTWNKTQKRLASMKAIKKRIIGNLNDQQAIVKKKSTLLQEGKG